MLTTVMCSKRSATIRSDKLISKRRRSGMSSFRSLEDSRRSTNAAYCTVIWRVRICSCSRTCKLNWAILTSPRSSRKDWVTRKQEHPTMPVLRCGATNLTIVRVIFGLSAVYYTKCVPLYHLSEPTICKVSTRRLSKVNSLGYLITSVKRWPL